MTAARKLRALTAALAMGLAVAVVPPIDAPAVVRAGVENAWRPLEFADPVIGKNFYLFDAVGRTPAVRSQVQHLPALAALTRARVDALDYAAAACGADSGCHAAAFKWSDRDVELAERGLRELASDRAVADLIARDLRLSGMFEPDEELANADFLASAWRDAVFALNRIIDVYALGTSPLYSAIDAVTYDPKSATYQRLIDIIVAVMHEQRDTLTLFYEPTLTFARRLLDANRRDEAARFEPLHLGENAAAFRRVPTVDWSRYPYSAIVVPGAGSELPDVALSPWGKLRVELAAVRFKAGKAPYLIVSGGFVHPSQTRFNEALEMKRSLMHDFGVAEDAILIDPHARHTTTNLRNAARLVLRYGLPADKLMLVTTDQGQSASISSDAFRDRCLREMGYMPGEIERRLTRFDLEFRPSTRSLRADARDPLDP